MVRSILARPRLILAGLALLALGGTGAGVALQRPASGAIPPSPPAVVGSVSCLGSVDVEGGPASLTPEQPGRVVEVLAREGESVAAGAVLLKLDDRPARYALEQAEATARAAEGRAEQARQEAKQHPERLAQQRAAAAAARHRLAAARHAAARQRELQAVNSASAHEADAAAEQANDLEDLARAAEARLAELEAVDPALAVRTAEAESAAAGARLRQARHSLEQCELRAPEAGTVLRVSVRRGELAGGPGAPTAVLFAPDRPLVVRAEVEQEFIDRVAIGRSARVADEANPALTVSGTVSRVAGWFGQRRPRADHPARFQDVPTVECVVALAPGHPPLRIGQRVVVTIPGAGK
jgi:HlyD family secretion protein